MTTNIVGACHAPSTTDVSVSSPADIRSNPAPKRTIRDMFEGVVEFGLAPTACWTIFWRMDSQN